jgi:TatD DNase family protein
MNWRDAHNHLQDARLDAVVPEWLPQAEAHGVARMVVNGTCPEDWPQVAALAQAHSTVIPSFGLHPWRVDHARADWFDALRRAWDDRPSAAGEIGLDRWMPGLDLVRQEEAFLRQWREAAARELPVTIHCLRHWGHLLKLLRSEPRPPAFLLHSYGGPREMVPEFAALGAYFSVSPAFLWPSRAAKWAVFLDVPADRLLLETDAPDMVGPPACVAHPLAPDAQGRPVNHPGNLIAFAHQVAAARGESIDALAVRTAANFQSWLGPLAAPPGG